MERDSYGLKSHGTSWITIFAEIFCNIYFVLIVADPDSYHRWARNPNFEEYYELLLVYVDDKLCCSHNPQVIIDALALTYYLKDRLVVLPTIYLGADMNKYKVNSRKSHWGILSTQYTNNSIKTV